MPLLKFLKVKEQLVINPYNHRGAPIVTIFIRSAGSRTHCVWRLLNSAPAPWDTPLACSVQETHFTCVTDSRVLEDDFVVLTAYSIRSSVRVSLLVEHSLNSDLNLVFADDGGRLVVADITVKSFEFRFAAVYAPNIAAEKISFFRL